MGGNGEEQPSTSRSFQIRLAEGDCDVKFILDCFDSTIPFLHTIGSSAQWGDKPFSDRPEFVAFIQDLMATKSSNNVSKLDSTAYIVEKSRIDNDDYVACGAAIISNRLPDYVLDHESARIRLSDVNNFLYLNVLVTHKGLPKLIRGAGGYLIEHIKGEAKRLGNSKVLVDCWNGNDGALIK